MRKRKQDPYEDPEWKAVQRGRDIGQFIESQSDTAKKEFDDVTKEQFERYVRVQMSGVTNMFDTTTVSRISGLQQKTIFKIMNNYGELSKKYPGVVK